MLIDTHAHLNFPDYQKNLDQVIKNSLKNGVKKIICVSSNLADSQKAIEITKKYPGIVYAAVGIHPQKTNPENQDSVQVQIQELEKLAEQKEVVAIGECGLDYSTPGHGEESRSKDEQFFLFQKQVEIALKLNLPLVVHSRKAFDDTIEILSKSTNSFNESNGVFHCYSAGKSEIKKVQDLGFYFGIDGNLTYDSGLQNVVKQIPLEKIVLETDSPFLSPEPFRSLPNDPGNVKIIAEFLSQILGFPVEKICQLTTENAQKLFPKIR